MIKPEDYSPLLVFQAGSSADLEGQEYIGQQTGWADQKNFKLELMGETNVLPCDRESGSTVTLGSMGGKHQICPRGIWDESFKMIMADSPAEVPLHQCTQYGN